MQIDQSYRLNVHCSTHYNNQFKSYPGHIHFNLSQKMLDRLGVGTSSPQKMQSFFSLKIFICTLLKFKPNTTFPRVHRSLTNTYNCKGKCIILVTCYLFKDLLNFVVFNEIYSSRTLKNLLHFTYKKTHIVFPFFIS